MNVLYFSWIREKLGKPQEGLELPTHVVNVGELMDWLATRGSPYSEVFGPDSRSVIRIAVNLCHADPAHPIRPDDEIAFFPPVTGG